MANKEIRRALQVALGYNSPTYALWPVTTGVPATGVQLDSGAAAWGAYVDIIAAAAITTEFWLMAAIVDTAIPAIAVFGLHEVEIYNLTTTTTVYQFRVDNTADNVNTTPFPIPIPVWCSPNDQIQGRTGALDTANKINCSLLVATGL